MPTPTGDTDVVVTFRLFESLRDGRGFEAVPWPVTVRLDAAELDGFEGHIAAALGKLSAQDTEFNPARIGTELGSNAYAEIRTEDGTVAATDEQFDASKPIAPGNSPAKPGHFLPRFDEQRPPVEFGGRSGGLWVLQDRNGMELRFDTDELTAMLTVQEAAGTSDTLEIVLPRGITESDIVGIGNMLSDEGIPEAIWGPMTVGEFPSDPQWLREGARELRVSAKARMSTGDHDEAGLFYRVAGLLLQASARDE